MSFRPIKVVPEDLPSRTFLKETTGVDDGHELFKMIDRNFKNLPNRLNLKNELQKVNIE
jgi:hypothetical protein